MTESEVYEFVTGSGSSDFALLAEILSRHGAWCLIGGLAVNCYVEPVYTLDADIVVTVSEIDSIQEELKQSGFAVEQFAHSINAQMKGSTLRIQLTTDKRYQQFLNDIKVMEVLGIRVPVATLDNIVRGKVWAWSDEKRRASKRKKDELDLMRILEAYPNTRPLMPEEIGKLVPE